MSEGVVWRALPDGSEYRIVTVSPSAPEVVESMAQQGLDPDVDVVGDAFIAGLGREAAASPQARL